MGLSPINCEKVMTAFDRTAAKFGSKLLWTRDGVDTKGRANGVQKLINQEDRMLSDSQRWSLRNEIRYPASSSTTRGQGEAVTTARSTVVCQWSCVAASRTSEASSRTVKSILSAYPMAVCSLFPTADSVPKGCLAWSPSGKLISRRLAVTRGLLRVLPAEDRTCAQPAISGVDEEPPLGVSDNSIRDHSGTERQPGEPGLHYHNVGGEKSAGHHRG
jgi:hypothetical protein